MIRDSSADLILTNKHHEITAGHLGNVTNKHRLGGLGRVHECPQPVAYRPLALSPAGTIGRGGEGADPTRLNYSYSRPRPPLPAQLNSSLVGHRAPLYGQPKGPRPILTAPTQLYYPPA